MKNKIKLIFAILLFSITINIVKAQNNLFTFNHETIYSSSIQENSLISTKSGYIFLESAPNKTIIHNYDSKDNLIASKEIDDITNCSIKKINDNYLIVGISSNTLKLYLIDSNLQIKSQKQTSYMIDLYTTINIYLNNDKAYLLLTEDNILSNNNLYEISNDLTIKENKISSYDGNLIKQILKSDYYLIHNNDQITDNKITHYFDTTYTEDSNILVGTNENITIDETLGYEEKAILTILNNKNEIVLNKSFDKYTSFNNVLILKDKIVILAHNYSEDYLLTFDLKGNLLNEEPCKPEDETYKLEATSMTKVSNNLVIVMKTSRKDFVPEDHLKFYDYTLNIYKEESNFGTITTKSSANSYEEISFNIVPNSGYLLDNITIKDSQGNIIPAINNKFIMPENDITISATYKEDISNPETADIILLVSISLIFISIIAFKLYKKLSWLK